MWQNLNRERLWVITVQIFQLFCRIGIVQNGKLGGIKKFSSVFPRVVNIYTSCRRFSDPFAPISMDLTL